MKSINNLIDAWLASHPIFNLAVATLSWIMNAVLIGSLILLYNSSLLDNNNNDPIISVSTPAMLNVSIMPSVTDNIRIMPSVASTELLLITTVNSNDK